MGVKERRERERQAREELILDAAHDMVVAEGYLGLNMDRLAEAIEYSKGTVYQHFQSKEDILLGLTVRTMQMRSALFARGAALEGRPRERLMGIGVADMLFLRLHPGHFEIESIVKATSLWEKGSEARKQELLRQEERCLELVTGVVLAGIEAGDLPLDPARAIEVTAGLWSMALGAHLLASHGSPAFTARVRAPEEILLTNFHRFLDGLPWHPLFPEHDYERVRARVEQEVFPDELERLARTAA